MMRHRAVTLQSGLRLEQSTGRVKKLTVGKMSSGSRRRQAAILRPELHTTPEKLRGIQIYETPLRAAAFRPTPKHAATRLVSTDYLIYPEADDRSEKGDQSILYETLGDEKKRRIELEAQLSSAKETNDYLQSSLERAENRNHELQANFNLHIQSKAELESKFFLLESNLKQLSAQHSTENSQHRAILAARDDEIKSLRFDNKGLQEMVNKQKEEIFEMNHLLQIERDKSLQMHRTVHSIEHDLKNVLGDRERKLADMEQDLKCILEDRDRKLSEMERIIARSAEHFNAEHNEARIKISELEVQLSAERQKLASHELTVAQLQEVRQELSRKLRIWEEREAEWIRSQEVLGHARSENERTLDELRRQNADLHRTEQEHSHRLVSLQEELSRALGHCGALEGQLQAQTRRHEETLAMHARAAAEREEALRERLRLAEARLEEVRAHLGDSEGRATSLEQWGQEVDSERRGQADRLRRAEEELLRVRDELNRRALEEARHAERLREEESRAQAAEQRHAAQLGEERAAREALVARCDAMVRDAQREHASSTAQLTACAAELSRATEERDAALQALDEAGAVIHELRARFESKSSKLREQKERLAGLSEALKVSQGRLTQVEWELATAVSDNRRLATDCLELQHQLRIAASHAERSQEQAARAQEAAVQAQEQAAREARACAELRRESANLRGRAVAQAGMSGKLLQLVGQVVASDARSALAPAHPSQAAGVDELVEQLQAFAASRISQD